MKYVLLTALQVLCWMSAGVGIFVSASSFFNKVPCQVHLELAQRGQRVRGDFVDD